MGTLNETYTTTPIVLSGDTGKTSMAKEMEKALLALPNGVVDGVSVNATYLASDTMGFYVFFSGTSVQGPQNMLVVETAQCGNGCTPQLEGVDIASYKSGLGPEDLSTVTEYAKCDYNSGLCDCFEGYTGYKCQVQTALI